MNITPTQKNTEVTDEMDIPCVKCWIFQTHGFACGTSYFEEFFNVSVRAMKLLKAAEIALEDFKATKDKCYLTIAECALATLRELLENARIEEVE